MLARILFAVFVALLGLDLGAGLYETRVLVPRWESPAATKRRRVTFPSR